MDPRATVQYWMDFVTSDDGAYAKRASENYAGWLKRGGGHAKIELSPGTDSWMRGDRFGKVVKLGRKYMHVLMDRSGRTLRVTPANVYKVY